MKRGVFILGFLLAITIAGSVLTAGLAFDVPTIMQSTDPSASVFMATNNQLLMFMVLVVVLLVLPIFMAGGLALVLWFLNKQVKIAKEMPTLEERREQEALPEAAA
ncbi:MAG: hypothetical protein Phog2KO_03870 [Phototrophicaceae bacterium]